MPYAPTVDMNLLLGRPSERTCTRAPGWEGGTRFGGRREHTPRLEAAHGTNVAIRGVLPAPPSDHRGRGLASVACGSRPREGAPLPCAASRTGLVRPDGDERA